MSTMLYGCEASSHPTATAGTSGGTGPWVYGLPSVMCTAANDDGDTVRVTFPHAGPEDAALIGPQDSRVLAAGEHRHATGDRVVLDQLPHDGDHFLDAEKRGWRRSDFLEGARLQ
jgi:hypothetical protein